MLLRWCGARGGDVSAETAENRDDGGHGRGAYGGQCRMDSMMVSMNNCTVTVSFSRLRFRSFFVIKLFSICWL
jgi:hypothetical protein